MALVLEAHAQFRIGPGRRSVVKVEMERRPYVFRARDKTLELGSRTGLVGIVNVTPDSFSDGGEFYSTERAVKHSLRLVEEGADVLDIGGESTRPGATPVPLEEELSRVIPVIEAVRPLTNVMISIDTYNAEVAELALEAGGDIVNDVSGFRFDSSMPEVVARWGAGVILMHCRGEPATMHRLEPSDNILDEVEEGLQVSVNTAYKTDIARDRILLDPGIGFGKNTDENLVILNRLKFLGSFDLPVLVGPSRKSFIGNILGLPVNERLMGTAASSSACILRGAHLLRVHDVAPIRQVTQVIDAIASESLIEE